MKQRVKDLLIDRLNTPGLKLAYGVLRKPNGCMCTLGHIADLYIEETGELSWSDVYDKDNGIVTDDEGFLPDEIRQWAGLREEDEDEVYQKNDRYFRSDLRTTPAEMAEFIREHIPATGE